MAQRFQVRVLEFTVLREVPGVRTSDDYVALLDAMEFGDRAGMTADDLREVCFMALQDLGPRTAAAVVLAHDLGAHLRPGQIRDVAHDMCTERMWEEYPDMALHERLFHVGSLLYAVFPESVPEPGAVQVRLEIVAANDAAEELLAGPLHESLLVRLLADGMDGDSVLRRLFDEQLAGPSFPEAESIVWIVATDIVAPRTQIVQVTSSGHWLDPLRETRSFESSAYAD